MARARNGEEITRRSIERDLPPDPLRPTGPSLVDDLGVSRDSVCEAVKPPPGFVEVRQGYGPAGDPRSGGPPSCEAPIRSGRVRGARATGGPGRVRNALKRREPIGRAGAVRAPAAAKHHQALVHAPADDAPRAGHRHFGGVGHQVGGGPYGGFGEARPAAAEPVPA
ncbi:hypothetical protein [Amycolatopsis sp. PS_44_ISF1]|uniref:hypothetical protein n=1 Tax=Amycolatopsis sp. PS_44_ISF1 TaxID=2974917 RepID=UPI0028DD4726|nr:hypothetical protein [Amycolatopsis sp. PS_44_ISF1]MDT8913781.1 hypothetical protein [Amycolatopsis sp. PS_44_ISF1]